MTDHPIILEIAGDVAKIILNQQDKLNALSPYLLSEILSRLDDPSVSNAKSILITGDGRAFCAGADLTDPMTDPGSDLSAALEAYYHPLFRRLAAIDKPVVSAINGPAVGAGVALAMAADISVMARSAYLQLGFVNIGLVPDSGLSWLLTRSVGRVRALELALLGERIDAERALAMGLVTRVADDECCLDDAMAIARRLAAGPRIAIGLIRRQIAAALDADYEAMLAIERDNQAVAGKTADFREGVASFREKRLPDFKGY